MHSWPYLTRFVDDLVPEALEWKFLKTNRWLTPYIVCLCRPYGVQMADFVCFSNRVLMVLSNMHFCFLNFMF